MADKISKERRSANMSAIRSKHSKPEMQVRRLLHSLGYRFRLHRKDLPGKPDIVLPGRQAVIEVRGCFWHVHPDPKCKDARPPASNKGYWSSKLGRNVQRDAANLAALEALGWRVLVLWECEVASPDLAARLSHFLNPTG
ncbi:very short patch repair endonuclease [Sphingomonas glaciei]|uniref:Very short patch repair endonuclease n=1 Tax=Sphingomonas glaciei TaxID=2938948 RepID=A0ABY5MYW5_9SPHN|nr:DNA mismatch endonuclease Vsr [Sphingomonas glaciei]UUR08283.1 DNA mismatch endonuclease Vsr [Sphingomonas glaciei]